LKISSFEGDICFGAYGHTSAVKKFAAVNTLELEGRLLDLD
jgi:hypothetical protein